MAELKLSFFTEFCGASMLISKSIYFVEQLSVATSETSEFKHINQIRNRDSVFLLFEKLLTYVNRGHQQIFLSNIRDKYFSD